MSIGGYLSNLAGTGIGTSLSGSYIFGSEFDVGLPNHICYFFVTQSIWNLSIKKTKVKYLKLQKLSC